MESLYRKTSVTEVGITLKRNPRIVGVTQDGETQRGGKRPKGLVVRIEIEPSLLLFTIVTTFYIVKIHQGK